MNIINNIRVYYCGKCSETISIGDDIVIVNRCYCKFHNNCFPNKLKRNSYCPSKNCGFSIESFEKGTITTIEQIRKTKDEDE